MNSDRSYSVFARYYDLLTENVDYEARAAYLDELIRQLHPVEDCVLLDLACGTGTLSEAMARRGYDVIGVDGSGDMLNEAVEKKCESGLPIQYVCQDMRRLELYGTVDVTICMLDSLNHLPGLPDIQNVFRRVSQYTEPGGLFLFDVNTLHKHRVTLGDQVFLFDLDEVYCVWENRFDGDATVTITLDFFLNPGTGSIIPARRSSSGSGHTPGRYWNRRWRMRALQWKRYTGRTVWIPPQRIRIG